MAERDAAPKAAAPKIRRIKHPSLDERLDMGRAARDRTPPSSHAGWKPARDLAGAFGLSGAGLGTSIVPRWGS
jgi:hypothetical protein